MLLAQRKNSNTLVRADKIDSLMGSFQCPECKEPVVLKKSSIRIDHFAHRNISACSSSKPESDLHRKIKLSIFEGLLKEHGVEKAALERPLKTCRPDVSAWINGVPVAIEVQISKLSIAKILARTIEYTKKGIYVLWLLPWSPYLDGQCYCPRLWETWLHTMYFGRIFYWRRGIAIESYSFLPRLSHSRSSSSRGGRSAKSSSRKAPLKPHVFTVHNSTLNLARDFSGIMRKSEIVEKLLLPKALLFAAI